MHILGFWRCLHNSLFPLRCFISSVPSWILSFLMNQELMWQKGVVFYSTWLPLSFVTFQGSKWPQDVSERTRGEKSKERYFMGAWECLTWRKHRSGDPPPCWLCLLGQSAVHANNPTHPRPPRPHTPLLTLLIGLFWFQLKTHAALTLKIWLTCAEFVFFCRNQNFHPLLGQASRGAVHESNTSRLLYPGAATLSWTSCFFTYYRKVSFVSVHTTLKGMYWSAICQEKIGFVGFQKPQGPMVNLSFRYLSKISSQR